MVIRAIILCLTLVVTTNAYAGDTQAKRIEELERDNYNLVMEVSRLRDQIQRYRQTQARRPVSRGYTQRPLQQTNQTLRDLEQTQRSLERLTK